MSESIERVRATAGIVGLDIKIVQMPASTRTAEEAAAVCGCDVAQIVKSMIFEGRESGALKLFLVSGRHQADMDLAGSACGEPLKRANPDRVRAETGFAIGGVAPLGHLAALETWVDEILLDFDVVWAAAGGPNTVFAVAPGALRDATGGVVVALA